MHPNFQDSFAFSKGWFSKPWEEVLNQGLADQKRKGKKVTENISARKTITGKLHFVLMHDVLWKHFPLLSICYLLCRFTFLPCPSICSADQPQETDFPGSSPKDSNGASHPAKELTKAKWW